MPGSPRHDPREVFSLWDSTRQRRQRRRVRLSGVVVGLALAGQASSVALAAWAARHGVAVPAWLTLPGPPWALAGAGAGVALLAVTFLRRRGSRVAGVWLLAPAGCLLLAISGPLPAPWLILQVLARRLGFSPSPGWVMGGLVIAAAAVVALLLRELRHSGEEDAARSAHGTARPGELEDVREAGWLGEAGTVLGGWRKRSRLWRSQRLVPLRDDSEAHVLLMMPTGAGKSTGPILSTLLSTDDSAIVLDPKGELYERSAGWRARQGNHCIRFFPTRADSMRWNPLAEIPPGPGEAPALRTLADNLVTYPADQGESHWTQSARNLFYLLALHSLYSAEASIPAVRHLLNHAESHDDLFRRLAEARHDPAGRFGFRDPVTAEPTATHPEVRTLARAFEKIPQRERGSIVSTLQTFLAAWGDARVAANTSESDFLTRELLAPKRSLYIGLSYGELSSLAPLLRLLLASLTWALTEGRPAAGATGPSRVLFLLDEFPALGRVPILEQMLAFHRSYGVRAHLVVQDLAQLRRNYGANESISGNCQIHVGSATQSPVTRRHLSQLTGDATVRYRRRSVSGGLLLRRRTTWAPTEVRRPLLTEGEVGALPEDRLLIVKTGVPPTIAWKYPYFRDPELLRRSSVPAPAPGRQKDAP